MQAKKLIVVGGVAGGASAAARARRLDEKAQIILFERGPFVSFANCGLAYHIGGEIEKREALQVQTPEGLRLRYGIDVRIQSEVVSIDRANRQVIVQEIPTGRTYSESYNKLILSPGACPIRPPIPGIDHPRILCLRNIPDMDRILKALNEGAKNAVVVGGGFIGLEMAENLVRRGLKVDLVEMLDQVLPPLDREMATPIHQELVNNGVSLSLQEIVASFESQDHQVVSVLKSGRNLASDLVVLAIGLWPEVKLAQEAKLKLGPTGGIQVDKYLRTSDPNILAVGDAIEVKDFVRRCPVRIPLAGPANRQGRIAADNAFGRTSVYRGSQGTSIVRVFGLVAASTGSSEKMLKQAGIPCQKVYIHATHHAGYFPGAKGMTLKLIFGADGGVLGAQIVGSEGVDKRIDVLATAIQAKMTVFDLEEMELAYAPQFGSAKDPINLSGFVASNLLRGDVKFLHADSIPRDGITLLDVRTPEEHEKGHIPGSKLIPLDDLRPRLGELPAQQPVVVYCQAGMRGYLASRILKQNGLTVWNLSGGYQTYCLFHPSQLTSDTGARAEIAN